MRLSREKIVYLSHVIINAIKDMDSVDLKKDTNAVRLEIMNVIKKEMKREEEIEQVVRRKIESQKKGIPEGSREWEILYKQYYDEEIAKIRKIRE
jgi:hypothetical protein